MQGTTSDLTRRRNEIKLFSSSLDNIRQSITDQICVPVFIKQTFSELIASEDGNYLIGVCRDKFFLFALEALDEHPIEIEFPEEIQSISEMHGDIIVSLKSHIEIYEIPSLSLKKENIPIMHSVGTTMITNKLIVFDKEGNLISYDLDTDSIIESVKEYDTGYCLSGYPGSTFFATVGDYGMVYFWDNRLRKTDEEQFSEGCEFMSYNPKRFALVITEHSIKVWQHGSLNVPFEIVSEEVQCACLTKDCEFLFLFDTRLKAYNLSTQQEVILSQTHLKQRRVKSMVCCNHNKYLILGLDGGNLLCLRLVEDFRINTYLEIEEEITNAIALENSNKMILSIENRLIPYEDGIAQVPMGFEEKIKAIHSWNTSICCVFENGVKIIPEGIDSEIIPLDDEHLIYFSVGYEKCITGNANYFTLWNSEYRDLLNILAVNMKELSEVVIIPHKAPMAKENDENRVFDQYAVGVHTDSTVAIWDLNLDPISSKILDPIHCGSNIVAIAPFQHKNKIILFFDDKRARIIKVDFAECTGEIYFPSSVAMPTSGQDIFVIEEDEICAFKAGDSVYFVSIEDLAYLGSIQTSVRSLSVSKTKQCLLGVMNNKVVAITNPCDSLSDETILCDYRYTFVVWHAILLFYDRLQVDRMISLNIQSIPSVYSALILPSNINFLHFFVHFGKSLALKQGMKSRCPVFTSRFTNKTPLSLALNNRASGDINMIIGESAKTLAKDPNIYRRFERNLCELNRSSVQALPMFYTSALKPPMQTDLPKTGKTYENILFFDSTSIVIDISKFLLVGVSQIQENDRESSEKEQLVSFKLSAFRLNFTLGSVESIKFLKSLVDSKNPQIFNTSLIQAVLNHKWKRIMPFLLLQAFVYLVFVLLLCVFIVGGSKSAFLLHLMFFINLLSLAIEALQLLNGVWAYLLDVWNDLDIIKIIFLLIYYVYFLAGWDDDVNRVLLVVITFVTFIRAISYFRIIEETRYLIRMIGEIISDMVAFLIILFYAILSIAIIFYVMGNIEKTKAFGSSWTESFMIGFGDFSADEYFPYEWIMFVFATVINPLVLMNLLIAMMSATYERVSENSLEADLKEKAVYILEYEQMLRWNRHAGKKKFFHYCGIIGEDADQDLGEKWEGKTTMMNTQIDKLIKKIDKIFQRNKETNRYLSGKIEKAQNQFVQKVQQFENIIKNSHSAIIDNFRSINVSLGQSNSDF